MMLLHRLPETFPRRFRQILDRDQMNTGPVVLTWDPTPTPADFDPNVESTYPVPLPPSTLTVKALIYFITARTTQKQFAEFEEGDAILTFDADLCAWDGSEVGPPPPPLELSALRGLSFTLPEGAEYTPRSTGKTAAEYWDAFIGGEILTRTVLVTRSPQPRAAPVP